MGTVIGAHQNCFQLWILFRQQSNSYTPDVREHGEASGSLQLCYKRESCGFTGVYIFAMNGMDFWFEFEVDFCGNLMNLARWGFQDYQNTTTTHRKSRRHLCS